jgi:hypothetical protein
MNNEIVYGKEALLSNITDAGVIAQFETNRISYSASQDLSVISIRFNNGVSVGHMLSKKYKNWHLSDAAQNEEVLKIADHDLWSIAHCLCTNDEWKFSKAAYKKEILLLKSNEGTVIDEILKESSSISEEYFEFSYRLIVSGAALRTVYIPAVVCEKIILDFIDRIESHLESIFDPYIKIRILIALHASLNFFQEGTRKEEYNKCVAIFIESKMDQYINEILHFIRDLNHSAHEQIFAGENCDRTCGKLKHILSEEVMNKIEINNTCVDLIEKAFDNSLY